MDVFPLPVSPLLNNSDSASKFSAYLRRPSKNILFLITPPSSPSLVEDRLFSPLDSLTFPVRPEGMIVGKFGELCFWAH